MAVNETKLEGRIATTPVLKFGKTAFCSFRMNHTPRVQDENGKWVDKEGGSLWMSVKCFGRLAEYVGELDKGFPVVVLGRLEQNEWQDKDTGQKRSEIRLVANQLYPQWNAMNQLGVEDVERDGVTFRIIKLGWRFRDRDRGSRPLPKPTGVEAQLYDERPFD